jgi:hypothetical protein
MFPFRESVIATYTHANLQKSNINFAPQFLIFKRKFERLWIQVLFINFFFFYFYIVNTTLPTSRTKYL